MINTMGGEQDNVVFLGRRSFRMEIAAGPRSNELPIPIRAPRCRRRRSSRPIGTGNRMGGAGGNAALQPAKLKSSGTSVVALCVTTFVAGDRADVDVHRPRRAPPGARRPATGPAGGARTTGTDGRARADAGIDRGRPTNADRGADGRRDPGGLRARAAAPAARQAGARRSSPSGSRRPTRTAPTPRTRASRIRSRSQLPPPGRQRQGDRRPSLQRPRPGSTRSLSKRPGSSGSVRSYLVRRRADILHTHQGIGTVPGRRCRSSRRPPARRHRL